MADARQPLREHVKALPWTPMIRYDRVPHEDTIAAVARALGTLGSQAQQFFLESLPSRALKIQQYSMPVGTWPEGYFRPGISGEYYGPDDVWRNADEIVVASPPGVRAQTTLQHELAHSLVERLFSGLPPNTPLAAQMTDVLRTAGARDPNFRMSAERYHPVGFKNLWSNTEAMPIFQSGVSGPLHEYLAGLLSDDHLRPLPMLASPAGFLGPIRARQPLPDFRSTLESMMNYHLMGP